MPRVTNDREWCNDAPVNEFGAFHLWEDDEQAKFEGRYRQFCHYCGTDRISRWVPSEADIANNRKEVE